MDHLSVVVLCSSQSNPVIVIPDLLFCTHGGGCFVSRGAGGEIVLWSLLVGGSVKTLRLSIPRTVSVSDQYFCCRFSSIPSANFFIFSFTSCRRLGLCSVN